MDSDGTLTIVYSCIYSRIWHLLTLHATGCRVRTDQGTFGTISDIDAKHPQVHGKRHFYSEKAAVLTPKCGTVQLSSRASGSISKGRKYLLRTHMSPSLPGIRKLVQQTAISAWLIRTTHHQGKAQRHPATSRGVTNHSDVSKSTYNSTLLGLEIVQKSQKGVPARVFARIRRSGLRPPV